MEHELLRVRGGVYRALTDLFLEIMQGEITGILCSTQQERRSLVRLLAGGAVLTQGSLVWMGTRRHDADWQRAVGVVGRKSSLHPSLSLAENLYLSREGAARLWVSERRLNRMAQALFQQFGLRPDERPAARLDLLSRIRAELLVHYVQKRNLVLLDGWSEFLTGQEFLELRALLEQLSCGGMTFLVLDDATPASLPFCRTAAVIVRGKTVRCRPDRPLTEAGLYRLLSMEKPQFPEPMQADAGETVFCCEDLSGASLHALSFCVPAGEVVCVVDSGRRGVEELAAFLAGKAQPRKGSMQLAGQPFCPCGREETVDQGVCMVGEGAAREQLFENLSMLDNLCIVRGRRVHAVWRRRRFRANLLDRFCPEIGLPDEDCALYQLEPAMRIRLVYGRFLLENPKLLICRNPFASMDFQMRAAAEDMIRRFVQRGCGVLILSTGFDVPHTLGARIIALS